MPATFGASDRDIRICEMAKPLLRRGKSVSPFSRASRQETKKPQVAEAAFRPASDRMQTTRSQDALPGRAFSDWQSMPK